MHIDASNNRNKRLIMAIIASSVIARILIYYIISK
jgi:hypothetical protein